MKVLIFLISLAIALAVSLPCQAARKKPQPPAAKPNLVASVERIAQGRVFQSADARNVSFTLTPTRAFFTISF